MSIVLQNLSPANGAMNVGVLTGIQVDIIQTPAPLLSALEIFVEGQLAFWGNGSIFYPPFLGPLSSVSAIAGGFRIVLDRNVASRPEFINVQVRYYSRLAGCWSYRVGDDPVNDFYFSDGYVDIDGYYNPEPGIRRIHVRQLVGEWKPYSVGLSDGYLMPIILSRAVTPSWPNDIVNSLSSQVLDGYLFLVASTESGTVITKNETADPRTYSDGYNTRNGHMTSDGTLYLINMSLNGGLGGIEVYYGSDWRPGIRSPDFVYDSSTGTPEAVRLLDGQLTTLYVADGQSTLLPGGSRLYVGCSNGLTKIEAYDSGTDGYCDGYDGYGRSYTYGIDGSSTDFPVLGGTISNVVAISSDEADGIIFVATNDGTELGGGLSQISISRNARLIFMTKEGGYLPSNVIRDIASP